VTRPRAHHYVPIFYLKGFTSPLPRDQGYLWVYEKNKPIRKSKPINEAHERDLYSYEDNEGASQHLEAGLSKIESTFAPFFQEIDRGYHDFQPDESEGLAVFMALLWVRGPVGRDFVNRISAETMKFATKEFAKDAERFKIEYEGYLEKAGTKTKLSADEMRAYILGDDWGVEQKNHGYTLKRMFEGLPFVISLLRGKAWEVLCTEDDQYFCTSDCPVVTILPERTGVVSVGAGFGMPGVEVFFPLTKGKCLVLRDRAKRSRELISGKMVREINKFMMVGARRFIYASEKNSAMRNVFDKIGCKSVPGVNAFMREPAPK
jgi:hypothetical protein